MSIFENDGNYYGNYSVPAISFSNRKASSAEFRKYIAEHPSVQEDVPSSIIEELKRMPSAKPAGSAYYATLNAQLFTKFCKDVATAMMVEKSRNPQCVKVFSEN